MTVAEFQNFVSTERIKEEHPVSVEWDATPFGNKQAIGRLLKLEPVKGNTTHHTKYGSVTLHKEGDWILLFDPRTNSVGGVRLELVQNIELVLLLGLDVKDYLALVRKHNIQSGDTVDVILTDKSWIKRVLPDVVPAKNQQGDFILQFEYPDGRPDPQFLDEVSDVFNPKSS